MKLQEDLGLLFDKNKLKWDLRFLELARLVSSWSKDPSTKVGAVITKGKRLISIGYNGLPMGVDDTDERLNNRELKYQLVIHGEKNAILFAERSVEGATIFTWPFLPCSVCAAFLIQAGIHRVVAPRNENPRWKDNFILSRMMFGEVGIMVNEYNLVEDNGDAIGDRP